ncbi:hypothetical protein M436DRAFT_85305 [Aureobasidium namibiae CBS 147.97]|uniref:Uncharacterized protein n=1 Tax=Aureobasidium namibiae CBS 147.97 TaxID=1043004 RepID=A0A074X479_9PEZI
MKQEQALDDRDAGTTEIELGNSDKAFRSEPLLQTGAGVVFLNVDEYAALVELDALDIVPGPVDFEDALEVLDLTLALRDSADDDEISIGVTALEEALASVELLLVAKDDELVFLVDEDNFDTFDDEVRVGFDADEPEIKEEGKRDDDEDDAETLVDTRKLFDVLVEWAEIFVDLDNVVSDEMGRLMQCVV